MLVCIFSQEKNEIILGFSGETEEDQVYLRALLDSQLTLISIPKDYHRAKKNSVDLFTTTIGLRVLDVVQYENERCFSILLTGNKKLVFKMHGNRSNLLLTENDQVVELFNSRLKGDWSIDEPELHRPLNQTYEDFVNADYNVKTVFPTFGKKILAYLDGKGIKEMPSDQQWAIITKLVDALNTKEFYIAYEDSQPFISLMRDIEDVRETYHDPIEVLNRYYYLLTREYFLSLEKNALLKTLDLKIKKREKYLEKVTHKLDELSKARSEEEIANIIMANLHQIVEKADHAELYDFYHDKMLRIKLKPNLSPQKNAEALYRKGKNKSIEVSVLKKNIEHKEKELSYLQEERQLVLGTESIKSLRKLNKQEEKKDFKAALKPYIEFHHMGYAIYVGRNARHNDTLTLKIAKKDDLWLHAKDVAGSHVVIKSLPGQGFPGSVIEAAAQLAAYYSKRKSDSLCPVIYTPRKFVRKVKGAKPGAVMVDKEKIVIVRPEKLL